MRVAPQGRAVGRIVWVILTLATAAEGAVPRRTPPPVPNVVTPVLADLAKLGGLADARGDQGDQFAYAVAIDGDTAVVGAPGKDSAGVDAGAALVFARVGSVWTLQATLLPQTPADGLAFGASVSVSNDTLVVGATGSYSSLGKAYVYVRSGVSWSLQATLTAVDGVAGDSFGSRVAASGNTAVVTAPDASTGFGFRSGAAYVFARAGSSWSEQQKVLPADLAAEDHFGYSVSLDGDSVLIGAVVDDTGVGVDAGSAYVFTRTGGVWSQQQKLVPPTASAYDYFGTSVALSGDVAVVGAPGVDFGGSYESGAAFVFERSGGSWSQTAALGPPSPTAGARYGSAVGVSAGVAVLGSGGYSSATPVYVFRPGAGTWASEATLAPSTSALYFGAAVAASGGSVVVGAPGFDDTGAAFVFASTSGAWAEQARLDNTGTTRGDAFGSVVVVDGDTMAVGSPKDDTLSARQSGSVTVFTRSGGVWTLQQKLAPEPGGTQGFGRTLALEGDLLVVGAGGLFTFDGSVYVFRRNGSWSLEQKLVPAANNTDFGAGVATSGGTVLVGEPYESVDTFYAGTVSVFVSSAGNWVVQQKLKPPTPTFSGHFGSGVAISGDVAVIGAPGDTPKAYVFRRAGGVWTSDQELVGTRPAEAFGRAIAMNGADLAVGSPANDVVAASGSVYVFHEAGGVYSLAHQLTCPTEAFYLRCGAVVALSADTLVAGAPIESYSLGTGSASVFARSGGQWVLRQQLLPSDTAALPSFGAGVALAGDHVVVGAPDADGGVHDSGAVYVFGPATADLSLAMTGSPLVVFQGDTVGVSLTVTNGGPATATGIAVLIILQPGLVFSSPSHGNCLAAPGGAFCTFGTLASGATGSVDFVAAAAAVGTFTSTARVAPVGPSALATTTVLAANADVAVTITTPASTRRGDTFDYWITVSNNGPAAAAAVQLSHPTPPGLVLDRVSGGTCAALPCLIPRIPVNSSSTILARYLVPNDYPGPDPIVNVATVAAANGDPVPANNTATGRSPLLVDNTHLRFYTGSPCRLVDTRDAARGGPLPLPPGPAFYTAGAGTCGVPYSARALAVNVAVTEPTADGYLKLYPDDGTAPFASFVNYRAGQTRSNNGVIGLDASSRFVVEVGQGSGTVHVIVDVVGYFQ